MIQPVALAALIASVASSTDRERAAIDRQQRFEQIRQSNESAASTCKEGEPCVLIFASGGSRGAYQAGATFTLIRRLREGPDLPQVAISGSSAGAMNALLAGLLWCMHDDELARETPEKNFMLETWADMNLDALFPGDRSCATYSEQHPELGLSCSSDSPYQEGDGVVTRNAFLAVRRRVLELLDSTRFRTFCRVPIALALTSERQTFINLGTQTVPTSRRTLVFELRTREDKTREPVGIHVCQAPPAAKSISDVDRLLSIRLPEVASRADLPEGCHWIDRQSMLDAATASAALPPLIAPQQLDFCAAKDLGCRESPRRDLRCPGYERAAASDPALQTKLCQERFIDGGVFDTRPVTAAREVALALHEKTRTPPATTGSTPVEMPAAPKGSTPAFVVVGSGPAEEGTTPDGAWQRARGIRFYEPFFASFFEVGRQYELQTLLRYVKTPEEFKVLYIQATQPLVGDYLLGLGALLDRRFTLHDYEAGLCFDTIPERNGTLPCEDTPERWKREMALVHAALNASHAAETEEASGDGLGLFIEKLRTGSAGECRFANSSPPIWCNAERGALRYQRRPGDGRAEDLPYISRFDDWSHGFAQQLLARAETVERRDRNTGFATALAAGGFYAALRAADVHSGFHAGSYTAIPRGARHPLAGALRVLFPSAIGVESVYYGRLRVDWSLLSFRTTGFLDSVRFAAGAFLEPPRATWPTATGPFLESWTRVQALPRLGDLGGRLRYDVNGEGDWRAFRPEFFVRPFFGRMELNLSLQLGPIVAGHPPLRLGLGVALTDVNGLLYWAVRTLAGSDQGYDAAERR